MTVFHEPSFVIQAKRSFISLDNFQVNGSGSAFTLGYVQDDLFHLKGVGLVE